MSNRKNFFMQILPFEGKTCFDCGDPSPMWECFKFFVPEGEKLYLCERCAYIREYYISEIKKPLPLEVVCDGCRADSHNEHHCEYENATVDGIKTRKPCTCKECSVGESSDVQKVL